mmetsp:Transcript_2155/g.4150  ORF Transcript_2155/g.4150 Transcript_2155/m.4150 type:complete len:976 (+) Transcript_2155:270-3197(+)
MDDSIASVPFEPVANEINYATNTSSADNDDPPHSFAPPVGTGFDLQARFQTGTSNLVPASRRPAQHRATSSFTIGSSAHNQTNHHTTMSGDVEALLRQWGGGDSSTTGDLGNTAHSDGFVSSVVRAGTVVDGGRDPIANTLRGPLIDEESTTIDFDSEQESLDIADGGITLNSTVTSRHRRIASAGGSTSVPTGDLNLSSPSRGLDRGMSERLGMTIHRTQSDDLEGVALHSLDGRSSAIHDAARITNWSLVASLSKTDPEAAKYAGPDRWTALHHACSRRCPHADVIDCLLRAYPEALLQTDDRGWNPLHHACRFKAPREVIRLLLRAYPELGKRAAAARCSMGRSPLYYAIRYDAPDGVVDMLLYADPGAVLDEDRDGVCPLGLVWDKYATGFDGKRTLHTLLKPFEVEGCALGSGAGNAHGSTSVEAMSTREAKLSAAEKKVKSAMQRPTCKHLRAKWQKVNSLLRAYFHFPLQDDDGTEDIDNANELTQRTEQSQGSANTSSQNLEISSTPKMRKWRVLHAVSAIKCHHMLFLLARALHPEEAQEIDENDLLGGGREVTAIPDPPSLSLDRQPISSRTALHFAAMSPLSGKEGRNVIKILLSLNPGAAKHIDCYGCLPLHLISQNDRKIHWTQDGLRDIYISYPDATSCKDSLGRTPLHCAASAAGHYLRPPPSPTQAARPRSPIDAAEEPNPQAHLELDTARDVGSVIQNLVLVNRNAASVADKTGRLPLHYIAEYAEEWTSDAECILAAHVAATRSRAGPLASGRLPLHMAASSTDARPSLIMNLVHANPRAASLVDGTGRLPLHLACESGRTTWDRGIESIYSAFTRAISMPEDSSRKWTVLHTAAASSSAGCELIETILKLHPNSASMADGQGKYPLHLACAANRSWEDGGVRILFEADPSAALVEDHLGLLPFHLTAMKSSEEAIHRDITTDTDNSIELGEDSADDLSTLEVLYNLLTAQPSIVQL